MDKFNYFRKIEENQLTNKGPSTDKWLNEAKQVEYPVNGCSHHHEGDKFMRIAVCNRMVVEENGRPVYHIDKPKKGLVPTNIASKAMHKVQDILDKQQMKQSISNQPEFDLRRPAGDGALVRSNFPYLNEIEYRIHCTERTNAYEALINNDMKSPRKQSNKRSHSKNAYQSQKKPLFKIKKSEPKGIEVDMNGL